MFKDILKFFYNLDHKNTLLIFYNNEGKIIKKLNLENISSIEKVDINEDFFSTDDKFGTFNIYHMSNNKNYFSYTSRYWMQILLFFLHNANYIFPKLFLKLDKKKCLLEVNKKIRMHLFKKK